MKIIEPKVELWLQEDAKAHVARCARVCYGRESGNDEATIKRLINDKHWSMFRHESVYAIVKNRPTFNKLLDNCYSECPYIDFIIDGDIAYVATNGNFMMDMKEHDNMLYSIISANKVDALAFANNRIGFELMRYTFKVTTQISTSRELNRASPNNISERSTRYVYEDGTLCRPHWLNGWNISETLNGKYVIYKNGKEDEDVNHKVLTYIHSCRSSFDNYQYLIRAGLHRQDARGVLPIDTATECVYSYSYKEWLEILKKRLYHTTGKAHPNCVIICQMIENELKELGYDCKF